MYIVLVLAADFFHKLVVAVGLRVVVLSFVQVVVVYVGPRTFGGVYM